MPNSACLSAATICSTEYYLRFMANLPFSRETRPKTLTFNSVQDFDSRSSASVAYELQCTFHGGETISPLNPFAVHLVICTFHFDLSGSRCSHVDFPEGSSLAKIKPSLD